MEKVLNKIVDIVGDICEDDIFKLFLFVGLEQLLLGVAQVLDKAEVFLGGDGHIFRFDYGIDYNIIDNGGCDRFLQRVLGIAVVGKEGINIHTVHIRHILVIADLVIVEGVDDIIGIFYDGRVFYEKLPDQLVFL